MNPNTPLAMLLAFAIPQLAAQEPPKPSPEHQKLAAFAGTWDVAVEVRGAPSKTKASSVQRLLRGGLWLLDDFTLDAGGMSFESHGCTGYDPGKGKYVTHWADGMLPSALVLEGNYDASGKVLTMTGMGVGHDGKPAKYRNVTTWTGPDTYVFEMFITGGDGKEVSGLKMTYTRTPAKGDAKPDDGKAGKK